MPPLQGIYRLANELKVIVETSEDLDWAVFNAGRVNRECHLFLQPEWSRRKEMIPLIVEFSKMHPEWKISLQSHKYMGIP